MTTHSVRLDKETEKLLNAIKKRTDLNISEILRRGVRVLYDEQISNEEMSSFELYRSLDLGEGGYSRTSSDEVKSSVDDVIGAKHGSD
jgi:hypothetical protein